MKNLFLHVVASGEMRQMRISKRGNHAAFDMMTTTMPKCDEIAASLILPGGSASLLATTIRKWAGSLISDGIGNISPHPVYAFHPLPGNRHSIFLKTQKQSQFRIIT
ncbi:MAG: hypothetical protein AB1746_02645 [Candidatus Zixiibacteriota bacterium]